MIVRWGLDALPEVLAEAGMDRPLLVRSDRWAALELPATALWSEIPSDRIDDAARAAAGADGVLAVGGGSAIDLGKAISAATGTPLVSVPTTYAGAEWTTYFGVRDPDRHMRGGGAGAQPTGIVYEPTLTLDLPRPETVGTALNALAHAAEALYAKGHNAEADRHALAGAELISRYLALVVEAPQDLDQRSGLLRGAAEAGEALGRSMLALGHAMAQAIGGRYGLPHGALNAVCLPWALRFNQPVASEAIGRLGAAMRADDAAARVEELARLGGFGRLRDLGVPRDDLAEVAEAAAARAGAKANPRTASAAQIAELLQAAW
jgi:maleylacetate reductase